MPAPARSPRLPPLLSPRPRICHPSTILAPTSHPTAILIPSRRSHSQPPFSFPSRRSHSPADMLIPSTPTSTQSSTRRLSSRAILIPYRRSHSLPPFSFPSGHSHPLDSHLYSVIDSPFILARHSHSLPPFSFPTAILIPYRHSHSPADILIPSTPASAQPSPPHLLIPRLSSRANLIPSRRSHSLPPFSFPAAILIPQRTCSFPSGHAHSPADILIPSLPRPAHRLAVHPRAPFSFPAAILIPSGHSHPHPPFPAAVLLASAHDRDEQLYLSKLENEKNHVAEMASPDMPTAT